MRTRRSRAKSKETVAGSAAGVTLIELLVALLIVMFGFGTLITAFGAARRLSEGTSLTMEAARLAGLVIEHVENDHGAAIGDGVVFKSVTTSNDRCDKCTGQQRVGFESPYRRLLWKCECGNYDAGGSLAASTLFRLTVFVFLDDGDGQLDAANGDRIVGTYVAIVRGP